MKLFHLERQIDDSGISGVGRVAEGVEFSDGTTAIRWTVGTHRSTGLYQSLDDVLAVHGHNGHTLIRVDYVGDARGGPAAPKRDYGEQ